MEFKSVFNRVVPGTLHRATRCGDLRKSALCHQGLAGNSLWQQARQGGASQVADLCKKFGSHVALEALSIGRCQHQHAKGILARLSPKRDQRHRHGQRRGRQPGRGFKAGIHAAVRRRQ